VLYTDAMKNSTLSLKTKVCRSPNALAREFENESVLLLMDQGTYYGLNEIGTRTWQLLERHDSLQPVLNILQKEYEAGEDRLEQDLLVLAKDLLKEGLLQIQGESCGKS
jgi:hypothetical protein